jgi:arylsulfatase A-like enzyme
LFITADQWRGDCLSAMGHPTVCTPHLDALAADGVLFRRHYAQCAPCGPSRASLYTGLYLHKHRSCINGTPLDTRHTNIALEMAKLGYDPVLFGYTDTAADPRGLAPDDPTLTTYEGVLPGFQAEVYLPEHHGLWFEWLANQGYVIPRNPLDLRLPEEDYPGAEERGPTFPPPRYKAEHTETAFLTGEIIRYLENRERDNPWFVHVSYFRPHPPFVVPEPYNALYHPDDVPPPIRNGTAENEAAKHPWLAWALSQGNFRAPEDDGHVRQLRATYYGMIKEVDDQLGRLIGWLKAQDLYDNTLIVLCSDHGEMLGDHHLLSKLGFYDQAFHIPLIVRVPSGMTGALRGKQVEQFTENVDVMPTILDLLAETVPLQCDGRSLAPFLTGEDPAHWRTEAHWEYDFRNPSTRDAERALGLRQDQCNLTVIRDESFKYVHFAALPPLFFDLADDPGECVNRAADPAYAPRVAEYAQKMLSWRTTHEERLLSGMMLGPGGVTEVREERY